MGKGKYGEVKTVTSFETTTKQLGRTVNSRQMFSFKNIQIAPDDELSHGEPNEPTEEHREKSVRILCKMHLRNNKYRYAIKMVNDDLIDYATKTCSIVDLAQEAYFLQRIKHPNIIRLRATVGEPGTVSFGLIVDRLTGTLTDKIIGWSKAYPECRGGRRIAVLNRLFVSKCRKQQLDNFYSRRLLIALDLARALRFLHQHSIVFRDMKPGTYVMLRRALVNHFSLSRTLIRQLSENVGFNLRDEGDVQLFDFGCAKELKQKDLVKPPDGYNFSTMVGTIRYMAPEVMKGLPYGLSCDVYAFSLILWFLFSFEKPFQDVRFASMEELCHLISMKHIRPGALPILSKDLNRLMEDCWAYNRNDRPSFDHICHFLRAKLDDANHQTLKRPFVDRTKHILDISMHSRSQYGV